MTAEKIEPLTRVVLQIEAGRSADRMDLTNGMQECDFIFGLGSAGLTDFEYALVDLRPGESTRLHIPADKIDTIFEHIHLPVLGTIGALDAFYLTVRIKTVQKAESAEVIKAMAAMVGCGCSCCGHADGPLDL